MRKILILSLLMFLVSISGEAQKTTIDDLPKELFNLDEYRAYVIQSFGWKCDKIQNVHVRADKIDKRTVRKIICEDNLIYYNRKTFYGDTKPTDIYCHKGKCQKFE